MADVALSTPTAQRQNARTPNRARILLPLGLLLPAMLVLLALQVYPAVYSIFLSLSDLKAGQSTWNDFQNYSRLFRLPSFFDGLRNTLVYAGSYLVLTVTLGMSIALLLNRKIKYTAIYLVILFIPWVLSDVVTGTIWRWLFTPRYGLVQEWISIFAPTNLLSNPNGAMLVVIAASVWQGLAFTTILSLGALQTVSTDVIESASLDGANRVQRFFQVILPIIRPQLLVMILLVSIRAINSTGLIFSINGGGPGRATQTVSIFLLQQVTQSGNFTLSSAVSVVMMGVNLVLTVIYLTIIGRRTN